MLNIIATGVTSGIGLATILKMSESLKGNYIILYRDELKLTELSEKLKLKGNKVDSYKVDLKDLNKLNKVLTEIKSKYKNINLIFHCSGIWPLKNNLIEGIEEGFIVNNLSPLLINDSLIEITDKIVQISAGLAINGKIDTINTPCGNDFSKISTYKNTKLWNLLSTYYYYKNYPQKIINSIHPGVINTNLGNTRGLLGYLIKQVKKLWKSTDYAACNILEVLSSNSKSFFFNEQKEYTISSDLLNTENANEIYKTSQRYIKRLINEKKI
jgi:short-subunit dehydrogenase